MATKTRFNVRTITLLAVLVALGIILKRVLGIDTQFMRIDGAFITHTAIGALFGPITSATAFGISDIIGFMLKPTGPYFPGFTLSAAITGVLYSLFYYRKELTLKRIIMANITITLLDTLFLTPIWLTIMYQVPFWSLMPARLIKVLIAIPIQVIIVYFVLPRVLQAKFLKQSKINI
ncbi:MULTISPECIES: folate family ECF transporter S component [unclassified Enterococcus]|uniref:folate family ECF transporter S component n=1 Tax=unclassified Enterococcus TaxID=2608891 RepID=UPI001553C797|nr:MULTISPECIES: folate family ECF transporter S component [unclassified Enterococcus]MBS7578123.1 folate family ECF transporter S component [Enterococcus sp. MMGLQ5-2]MBS7585383.1 folate family ECF transporter S component [Enterococcus sp. MMGLQ5-1]NPD13240.1 folate family ECF transporter S component [Enterococcus sp. MMGLQ5-1]NPD37954.1 folate family ECF transporter S component [Enterococcus sp. MMGLQ5-2]